MNEWASYFIEEVVARIPFLVYFSHVFISVNPHINNQIKCLPLNIEKQHEIKTILHFVSLVIMMCI